jgi:hypothetical protein
MVIVACAGVAAWLLITAARVARDPNGGQMSHLRMDRETAELVVLTHSTNRDFWPRYWRTLLGRPWPARPVCTSCRDCDPWIGTRDWIDVASSPSQQAMLDTMTRILREREAKRRALLARQDLAAEPAAIP